MTDLEIRELVRTLVGKHPNGNDLAVALRDLPIMRWNSKMTGTYLAHALFDNPKYLPDGVIDEPFSLSWQATQAMHYKARWFLESCEKLKIAPILHRKVWELAYVLNTLEITGKLKNEMRGIGFGCGQESFPSYFASRGVQVVATDMDASCQAAQGWIATNQHSSTLEALYKPFLIERMQFDRLVTFETADMNDIPSKFDGQYDFCWSVCAFEHLGSIEKGLTFIERTMELMKPGGVSVHTTEFNFGIKEETIDDWPTVLFRQSDFEMLMHRLAVKGYVIPGFSFHVGDHPVDMYIDVPPYPGSESFYNKNFNSVHLKVSIDGLPCTCYGLVVQKPF
jgi:2-polyprenyl-3-methyl-5-hydroxy-6-metoxy-1,4-benzoquinol methylase